MEANKIVTRVKDFLKLHPPYSYLTEEEVLYAASNVQILYFQDNEYIFQEEEKNKDFAFTLKKGRIELFKQFEGQSELIDVCEAGDVFGVRSLLTENPYAASARSSGDSLIYAVPKKIAQEIIQNNAQVALFFAAGFASGQTIVSEDIHSSKQARKHLMQFRRGSSVDGSSIDILVLNPVEDIVSCSPNTKVKEAALKMKTRRVGSIIVMDENRFPIGLVSDSDFTRKVIAGDISPEQPVNDLMSSPVDTLPPNPTVAQFMIRSMRKGTRRLIITEDGTDQSPVIGILSERDMMSAYGNNPAALVKRILKANSINKLHHLRNRADELIINYLEQEISIEFVADITTEINDALIHKAIKISLKKLEKEQDFIPKNKWAWLSLGSEGRGEQLLRTDQDNAIVYENPTEELAEQTAEYFLKLGTYVVDILIQCGFERCKGDIMASNPKWNQPLKGWKEHFKHWIEVPEPESVLNGNIFFDFRTGFGDISLQDELSQFIFNTVDNSSGAFTHFFVLDATDSPPPLSFFKNFIVERSGKHKDMFDIKQRAMMPLAGAARMLMIFEKIKGVNNTFERYKKLVEKYPQKAELFGDAAEAYEIFMRYRALNGFKNKNSGRFISPKDLNKIERQTLRTAFQSIEEVQRHLRQRFNLNYL